MPLQRFSIRFLLLKTVQTLRISGVWWLHLYFSNCIIHFKMSASASCESAWAWLFFSLPPCCHTQLTHSTSWKETPSARRRALCLTTRTTFFSSPKLCSNKKRRENPQERRKNYSKATCARAPVADMKLCLTTLTLLLLVTGTLSQGRNSFGFV